MYCPVLPPPCTALYRLPHASLCRRFALYVFGAGTWHSLPTYFLPWYTLALPDAFGRSQDLAGAGTAVFVSLVFAVTLKLCMRTHAWTWITHLVIWLSLALLFPFLYILGILWPATSISGVSDMSGVAQSLFTKCAHTACMHVCMCGWCRVQCSAVQCSAIGGGAG